LEAGAGAVLTKPLQILVHGLLATVQTGSARLPARGTSGPGDGRRKPGLPRVSWSFLTSTTHRGTEAPREFLGLFSVSRCLAREPRRETRAGNLAGTALDSCAWNLPPEADVLSKVDSTLSEVAQSSRSKE
jgi:hypothetical protein